MKKDGGRLDAEGQRILNNTRAFKFIPAGNVTGDRQLPADPQNLLAQLEVTILMDTKNN